MSDNYKSKDPYRNTCNKTKLVAFIFKQLQDITKRTKNFVLPYSVLLPLRLLETCHVTCFNARYHLDSLNNLGSCELSSLPAPPQRSDKNQSANKDN